MTEQILVRGPAPVVSALGSGLQSLVAQQSDRADDFVPEPEPVRPATVELRALGQEA